MDKNTSTFFLIFSFFFDAGYIFQLEKKIKKKLKKRILKKKEKK